jgi:hypothetical protein
MYNQDDEDFYAPETAYELCPAGVGIYTCFRIIFLGTQLNDFDPNDIRKQKQIALSFELAGRQTETGKPFVLTKIFNFSLGEKATLRKFAEALVGGTMPSSRFDILPLLGKSCQLSIQHNETKGKMREKIAGCLPIPPALRLNRP